MNKRKFLQYFNTVTCYLLVFLFTYTGMSKLIDHATFEITLLQSPIIKDQGIIISWLIPGIELIIVALLLLDKYRQEGLLLSLLLMLIFTGYIFYMILFIPNLPCSCGGILKQLSWANHLLLNGFILFSITISLMTFTKPKVFIAINRSSRKPV
jgi:hypothetical protein